MIVQKCDISMSLDKTDPKTIPLWIRMNNVPLEAWTSKGISTLASRVGKFARVMVDVSANKPLPSVIEVVYRNRLNEEMCKKTVNVAYDWKQPICSDCCVFGHSNLKCGKKIADCVVDNVESVVVTEKVLRPNFKPNTQFPKGVAKQGAMNGKSQSQFACKPKKKNYSSSNVPPDKLEMNEKEKSKEQKDRKEVSPKKHGVFMVKSYLQ
ncbi:RNA-directed DNA polymerase, eukaryota, reverse transcriptase zinc-binding domain protein [Tanacetum coccineum]